MQRKMICALLIMSAPLIFGQEEVVPAEQAAQEVAPAPVEITPEAAAKAVEQEPKVVEEAKQIPEAQPVVPAVKEVAEAPKEIPAEKPAPAPAAEVVPPAEEKAEEIEIMGIDTIEVSEPKGNWLYKRIWWEKAERLYEKTKELADKILELRMVFFAKRHELDRTIVDPFYLNLGLERGELAEIISHFLKQAVKKEEAKTEKEEEMKNVIAQEKKTLEQLEQDAQKIAKIDHAIDDALMKLIELLNQARSYEQQSWENFKAINRELSDKKARELYYNMDTFWKNLNNINMYLSDAYAKYFEQLTNKIQQETEKAKSTIASLKEKGIDIQLQAQLRKGPVGAPKAEKELEEEEEEEVGWLGTLWRWIKSPFVFVGNLFSGTYNWISSFFGGGTTEEEMPEEPNFEPSKEAAAEAPEEEE